MTERVSPRGRKARTERFIFEKKLYAYLPFYVMRYEHKFSKWEKDEKQQEFLQGECREALTRLSRELDDSPEEFMNLLEVMRRVADHVMRKQTALLERMDEVMGGKVWDDEITCSTNR